MHEVDMTKSLILTIQQWWEEQPEQRPIAAVHLMVGRFTCVEPVSLEFAFEVQKHGTVLANSTLEIQEIPLVAFCHTCQQDYHPEIGIRYACPTCQGPMEDIRSGRELKIDRIEYAIQKEEKTVGCDAALMVDGGGKRLESRTAPSSVDDGRKTP